MAGWVVSRREAPNPSLKHATGASCLSAQGPEPKAKVLEPRCTWWGQGRLAPRPRSPVRAREPRLGLPAGLPQGLPGAAPRPPRGAPAGPPAPRFFPSRPLSQVLTPCTPPGHARPSVRTRAPGHTWPLASTRTCRHTDSCTRSAVRRAQGHRSEKD